jgi:hypothetical protein
VAEGVAENDVENESLPAQRRPIPGYLAATHASRACKRPKAGASSTDSPRSPLGNGNRNGGGKAPRRG